MLTVIDALTPTSLAANRFRRHRNEGRGDLIPHCETHPTGSLRRFQVRDDGSDSPPATSSGVEEEHEITLVVTVAYPLDYRYGGDLALDRDDVMREDERKILYAVGMHGRANFTPSAYPDATWLGHDVSREIGEACAYLVISIRMAIILSLS